MYTPSRCSVLVMKYFICSEYLMKCQEREIITLGSVNSVVLVFQITDQGHCGILCPCIQLHYTLALQKFQSNEQSCIQHWHTVKGTGSAGHEGFKSLEYCQLKQVLSVLVPPMSVSLRLQGQAKSLCQPLFNVYKVYKSCFLLTNGNSKWPWYEISSSLSNIYLDYGLEVTSYNLVGSINVLEEPAASNFRQESSPKF